MMPGMDGYEAIRRIRKQERFRDLPVIALTARAGDEDLDMCLESGANDCVVKPVDPVEVKNLLDKYLVGRDGVEKQ
jgi:CheY-like chemotaxis protein